MYVHVPLPFYSVENVLTSKYENVYVMHHYANTPMQYTAIFHGCKNYNFRMKKSNIFLTFAQNIDRGYTLEPPQ